MASFAPYNKRYGKWKKEKVGHSNFWKLYGHLIKSLSVFPVGRGGGRRTTWMSGIPPGVKDQGGTSMVKGGKGRSMLISKYGRWGELGRKGQPARAIFAPTTKEYAQKGWRKRVMQSRRLIEISWR